MKKKNTDKNVNEENAKTVTRRTLRLEARVTEQEYTQAKKTCKDLRFVHERLRASYRLRAAPTATAV